MKEFDEALITAIRYRVYDSDLCKEVDHACKGNVSLTNRAIVKLLTAIDQGSGRAAVEETIQNMDSEKLAEHVLAAAQGKQFEVSFGRG